MQKTVKMTLKRKLSGNGQMNRNIYEVEKEIKPMVRSYPVLGLYTFI